MKLIGMVSTFNEGRLLRECLRSLLRAGVDRIYLFEGPFDNPHGEQEDIRPTLRHPELAAALRNRHIQLRIGEWETQAAKLTEATRLAAKEGKDGEPVWGMHLDGDEVLLWGEYLRDIVERFTEAMPFERFMNIKLVELDGTVGGTQTHLIRMDLIDYYVVSGSQIQFKGDSFPVSLHNPDGERLPMHGDPHILHRSALRPSGRDAPELRAHLSQEASWFDIAAAGQGLAGVKPGD